MRIYFFLLFGYFFRETNTLKTCIRKTFSGPEPNMVCVCNATYCDEFPPLVTLGPNEAAIYVSSISGKRFENTTIAFMDIGNQDPQTVFIRVDDSIQYQTMLGFGGAFNDVVTDSFWNYNLSAGVQANLLNAYFGQEGTGYTIGRVPMEAGDIYGYGDTDDNVVDDFDLKYFNLTRADFELNIPFIKKVQEILGAELRLFVSPWSAPAWMKASGKFGGGDVNSQLKGDIDGPYYRTWANYFIKYFEAYAAQGVNYWGMTVQNECVSGIAVTWKAMFMDAEMHRDFIKGLLGPALRNNNLTKDIFLMIMDDQRWLLPGFADTVLNDPEAAKYVNGIAVHWYEDFLTPANSTLLETHVRHPNHILFASEASIGYIGGILNPQVLGDWNSAIAYAADIIEDFQNWVTGWMDWTIWIHDGIKNPIIIMPAIQEFYKNPSYYAIGHFSKFIRPNSTRIELLFDRNNDRNDLDGVGFLTPSNQHVVVLQNRNMTSNYQVSIRDVNIPEKELFLNIEPRSLVTIVWNKI